MSDNKKSEPMIAVKFPEYWQQILTEFNNICQSEGLNRSAQLRLMVQDWLNARDNGNRNLR